MKKKYKIAGLPRIRNFLCDHYPDFFCKWEKNGRPDIVLRDFEGRALADQNTKKTIYFFQVNTKKRPRQNIRTSDLVDQHFLKENDENLPVFCRTMDISAPNFTIIPLCHNYPDRISMEEDYFKIVNRQPNDRIFNKCFWRGSATHYTRKNVIEFLNSKKNKLIDAAFWQPKTGSIYDDKQSSPKAWEYIEFFEEIKKSDMVLCIRGDRPWLYSFFDIMRGGAIPVCINTQYHNLGFENIGYKVDELFLSYDLTKGDTLEDVHKGIIDLFQNKERCLEMKRNVTRFYKNIYLTDRTLNVKKIDYIPGLTGFGDFLAAKIIDIIENNFKLKDNKLFTETVFDIKRCLFNR